MFPRSALVLTPKAFGADGVSALTRLVACSLSESGVETRVLALEQDARRDLSDGALQVPVESANGGKLQFLLNGIKATPRARRPDLVIATHLRMLPAAVPLMAYRVPVATFLLGIECWRPLSARDRGLVSRCARLLPISMFTRQRFLHSNPAFGTAAMTVCPLAVDPMPLPDQQPVSGRVLVVGRLWSEERYKGHDLLIDAWPEVQRACPDAHLVIVGDGDDRNRLESRVKAAGLDRAIAFTGVVSQQQLREHFAAAQVFVLPSGGEGFGIVFLEAMRAARPCLGGHGAAEEIVQDGITGRIVAIEDRSAVSRALTQLLQDPDLCRQMGQAGRQRVEEQFSLPRFSQRLTAALADVYAPC